MAKDLSFEGACQIIKGECPELVSDIDKFSSLVLTTGVAATIPITVAVGPTVLTPAAIILTTVGTLSNLFGVKNEILAISERVIAKVISRRDRDTLKEFERMRQAYSMICYTAFFEAIYHDETLLPLMRKLKMTKEEKYNLIIHATKDLLGKDHERTNDIETDWLKLAIDLPQPGDTFERQHKLLSPLYELLADRLGNFFELETVKEQLQKSGDQRKIKGTLMKIPKKALEYFKAQYYGLAMKYSEFAIWLNLQESENERIQQEEIAEYSRKLTDLAAYEKKVVDLGFHKMEEVINDIPLQIERTKINKLLQQLKNWYINTINEPVIDDSQQALIYPKKSEIFIPQAFRVLHYTGNERLEDEQTWENLQRRDDLSAFLLSYFNHPTSIYTPLIILGQPGSGKSLLSSMLAARLTAQTSSYTPIRVVLRHINTDATISEQIRDQIYKDTNLDHTWGEIVDYLEDRPPLVIFDGYDELLQATGKAFFLGYLRDIEEFQRNELKRGQKPIRAIVTSRISLIDKAVIPKHATIVRLLEFDAKRQVEWVLHWNNVNSTYFEQTHTKAFTLPQDNESINKLAEQPLLLMMLAIYDSVGNPLLKVKNLDQSLLYSELLRRFIERELKKNEQLSRSWQREELDEAIDREMARLGVAAIGMFNRRKLSINKEDLNVDLKFFDLEKSALERQSHQSPLIGERDLLPAEKMFGSFFFQQLTAVHKSVGPTTSLKHQGRGDELAYEFLHNTFGEFLTADFMSHKILEETTAIQYLTNMPSLRGTLSQKIERLDGLGPRWFTCFIYAPLFSRPVIVNLLHEWLQHCLERQELNLQEFLTYFDIIVTSHIDLLFTTYALPPLTVEGTQNPFSSLPILGHLAIYTLNLILLRTLFAPSGYIFDETKYKSSVDGTRVWDSLTGLWRAWFSFEKLNELAAILATERNGTKIHLKIKKISNTSPSNDRLNLIYNVSQTLADDVTAGLSGFLLHDSFRADKIELDTISKMLYSEHINEPLTIDLFRKQMLYLKRETPISIGDFDAISKDLRFRSPDATTSQNPDAKQIRLWSNNLESSVSALAEITQLVQMTNDPEFWEICRELVVTPPVLKLADEVAVEAIKLAKETGFEDALLYFNRVYFGDKEEEEDILAIKDKSTSTILLTELIRSTMLDDIPSVSRYIMEEILRKGQQNHKYIEIPLILQIIKFAREVEDQEILDYLRQDYIEIILKSQEYITTELGIEMIKLAREAGNQETLRRLVEKFTASLSIFTKADHILFASADTSKIALLIDILKSVYENDNLPIPKALVGYIKFIIKEKRRYLKLPVLADAILKFAHKINDQKIIDSFAQNYPLSTLQAQEQISTEPSKQAQEQKSPTK